MIGNNSFTNIGSLSEIYDLDSLKLLLKSIPVSRTNFYFETKTIQGFKENLQEEIQDLLIELQAAEENLQRIIKVFALFIDKHEKILTEKDEHIFNLTSENEKLLLKLSFGTHTHDPLIQENFTLLEKNSQLTEEIELLDKKCQEYEEIINKSSILQQKNATNMPNNKNYDINKEFVKNIESLKENFPEYFCRCNGDYNEIKQKNAYLRQKIAELQQERDEISENLAYQSQKVDKFERSHQRISFENEKLKEEISKIRKNRGQLLSDFDEFYSIRQKKSHNSLRVRSLSPQREIVDYSETEIEIDPQIQNKFCRSPLLRKKKESHQETLQIIRENVRRKTRAFSIKYNDLFSEIQKALGNSDVDGENPGTFDHIFENFNEKLVSNKNFKEYNEGNSTSIKNIKNIEDIENNENFINIENIENIENNENNLNFINDQNGQNDENNKYENQKIHEIKEEEDENKDIVEKNEEKIKIEKNIVNKINRKSLDFRQTIDFRKDNLENQRDIAFQRKSSMKKSYTVRINKNIKLNDSPPRFNEDNKNGSKKKIVLFSEEKPTNNKNKEDQEKNKNYDETNENNLSNNKSEDTPQNDSNEKEIAQKNFIQFIENEKKNIGKISNIRKTIGIMDFFVFMHLIMINIMNNSGFSLFGQAKKTEKRNLLITVIQKGKNFWFDMIKIWIIFWFFFIVLQIGLFHDSFKRKIRGFWWRKAHEKI